MTRPVGRRFWLGIALAALAAGDRPSLSPAVAQSGTAGAPVSYQVTLFAINAVPGSNRIDPKLAAIAPQLRKLLPNHEFKLLEVRSKSLQTGQSLRCELGNGLSASTVLVRPLDENGKIELRCALQLNGISQFDIPVATPPNQLFFCDHMLDDGSRLLVGVGAR